MENWFVPYTASEVPQAQSVLILAPHPDDEVFGCGGCVALHRARQVPVHVLLLTDGGRDADEAARAQYVAQRWQESQAAAAILGHTLERLPYRDRSLGAASRLAADIVAAALRCSADLIYAPSPWEIHPDHYHAALAAFEALRQLPDGVRLATYEVGVPQRPNTLVDITSVQAVKQQAMACFVTQLAVQRYADQVTGLNVFRSYTLGLEVAAAEALTVFSRTELDSDPCRLYASERQHLLMTAAKAPQRELELPRDIDSLYRRLASAEAENRQLRNSRSWRLTAPLRWLASRLYR